MCWCLLLEGEGFTFLEFVSLVSVGMIFFRQFRPSTLFIVGLVVLTSIVLLGIGLIALGKNFSLGLDFMGLRFHRLSLFSPLFHKQKILLFYHSFSQAAPQFGRPGFGHHGGFGGGPGGFGPGRPGPGFGGPGFGGPGRGGQTTIIKETTIIKNGRGK